MKSLKYQNFSNEIALAIFATAFILFVHIFTLMRFPAPSTDEAWMASRAWQFIQTGSSFGPLDHGVLESFEGVENFYSRLSSAIQSIGLLVVGSTNILAIRLSSFVVGLFLLFAVFCMGAGLKDKQLGFLGLILTASSWPFFLSAHLGRPDIIAATFGFSGLALLVNLNSGKIWKCISAGLLAALAFEIHAHAAIYVPAMTAVLIYYFRSDFLRRKEFWGFVSGGFIGGMIYLGFHILPNPTAFFSLSQLIFSITHLPPLFTGDLSVIGKGIIDMLQAMVIFYPLIIIALLAGLRLIRSRPPYVNLLIIINGALIISFTLLIRNKLYGPYSIYFTPGLCILTAAMLLEFLNYPITSKVLLRIRQIIILAICVLPLIPIFRFDPGEKYQITQLKINQAVQQDDLVMGNLLYWFGLMENRYLNWSNLVLYQRAFPGSSLEDAFKNLKPDVFILDKHVKGFVFDDKNKSLYRQGLSLSKSRLDDFLNQHAELVTEIDEGGGEYLQIYRINVDNQ